VLEVPDRPIRPEVLRPLLKACRDGLRLETEYVSLNTPNVEIRLIAPHTLVYTGMRWHVRAYCEKNGQYRDFVLSRLRGQPDLLDESPNTRELDEDWNTEIPVIFAADGRLNAAQKSIIETDFGMIDGQLVVPSRRALVKYVLQRYQIDPRNQATNPEAQQIVATNLKELRPWLMHD
jgi:predicted DNA-binding transcriptional regulator YafY